MQEKEKDVDTHHFRTRTHSHGHAGAFACYVQIVFVITEAVKCPSIYSCALANPESFMTKVGVEKVLSRLGTQKSIKVGFSSKKKAQVKGSLKPFEKATDRLKQTLVTERGQ